jgi:hypothetical protein
MIALLIIVLVVSVVKNQIAQLINQQIEINVKVSNVYLTKNVYYLKDIKPALTVCAVLNPTAQQVKLPLQ